MRARKLRLNPLNPPALRMTSYWRLWSVKNLSGHKPPARVSLPFLPDPHAEVEKEWKKPFSHIHRLQHTSYADIEGMRENGYEGMPPVEETIASYPYVGETSSLKAPSLPSKPLNLA